jgi:histidine triad (HIT) family protein
MNGLDTGRVTVFEEKEMESFEETLGGARAKKDDDCDFCAIVKNEVNRNIMFQDSISVAFLDRKPVFLGHCLLIPNKHYEMLSDLPKELVGPLFTNAQLLVKAVKIGLQAEGTFLAINNKVSQSVPHLHIHIIPRKYGDGLRGFFWPRQSYQSEEQMNEITNSIRTAIEKIQNGTVS